MAVSAPIFTKLRNSKWHQVGIICIKFHPTRSNIWKLEQKFIYVPTDNEQDDKRESFI
jgi:hypothetical protein